MLLISDFNSSVPRDFNIFSITMSTNPQAVLITGGTARLGLRLAIKTVEMGLSAVLHYRTSKHEVDNLLEKRPELHEKLFFIQADLLKMSPQHIIEKAMEFPITLAGLINNASVFSESNLFDQNSFSEMLQINALLPAALATSFYHSVGNGWILHITDTNIKKPSKRFQNYRISKRLLEEITKEQAFLFAPHFRVNAIAPGAMLPSRLEEWSYFDHLAPKIPLQKTGDIDSLLQAYEFLVTTPYVTGEILHIDGGWNLVT